MPASSRGCQTCKIRRIKCDENRPCHRCTKAHRICLDGSVPKEASFSIHIENKYASGLGKRPRGPRSSLITKQPQLDLQTRAETYYLQFHLQALKDVPNLTAGTSECLITWKVSGRTCPMVDLAVSSMALAVFSKYQQNPQAATQASTSYWRLLQMAQRVVNRLMTKSLEEADMESCLLAISLMVRYEGTTYRHSGGNVKHLSDAAQCWPHHDGAMAILKMWTDQVNHGPPSFIIKRTRRELIKSLLLRNLAVPRWMRDGDKFGELELELDYDRILVQAVNLNHAVIILRQHGDLQAARYEKLADEARQVEQALDDWAGHLPVACSPQQHELVDSEQFPRQHFFSSVVHTYSTTGYAAAWSHYLATRVLVMSVRMRLLESIHPSSSADCKERQQWLECKARLDDSSDRLASSVPFCLGRVKVKRSKSTAQQGQIEVNTDEDIKPSLASMIVWPLTITSSIRNLCNKQRLWFRNELSILGKVTGDGVLEYAETEEWPSVCAVPEELQIE